MFLPIKIQPSKILIMKKLFVKITEEPTFLQNIGITALRVYVGFSMAFAHGIKKVPPSEGFIQGVTELGFPFPEFFAWSAGLAELMGGILLGIGLLTRPSGFFIAFTMAIAAFGAHASDPFQKKELALMYMALSLFFMIRGSTRYSVDRFLNR
jgi:putative oxidoreductase